jgi:hypothetical protein
MHLPLPSISPMSDVLSQTLTSFAGRASTTAKNFESDLQSGNIAGAQSFLSALQQKMTSGSTGTAGNDLALQFGKIRNELTTGDLAGAQSDFSGLEQVLSQLKHGSAGQTTAPGTGVQTSAGGTQGVMGAPAQLPFDSSYLLQQSAYNNALNLSVPASIPSFSANW